MVRIRQLRLTALVAALALALLSVGSASAHAELESSVPAAGSTVTASPERVTLVFSQELKPAGNSVTVTGPSGAVVSQGDAALDRSDPNRATLVVALAPNLAAGAYTVAWVNASVDGHSEEGEFTFTVASASAPSSGSSPASLPRTGGDDLLVAGIAAGAAALVAGALARRRVRSA